MSVADTAIKTHKRVNPFQYFGWNRPLIKQRLSTNPTPPLHCSIHPFGGGGVIYKFCPKSRSQTPTQCKKIIKNNNKKQEQVSGAEHRIMARGVSRCNFPPIKLSPPSPIIIIINNYGTVPASSGQNVACEVLKKKKKIPALKHLKKMNPEILHSTSS